MSDAATVDPSAIPASAVPPGVDPAAYVAEKTAQTLSEPVAATKADVEAAQRPANVPEKFWDPANQRVNLDAILKSYSELETKMRQGEAKPAEQAQQETPAADAPAAEGKTSDQAQPSPVGDLITGLTTKYAEGKLADEDFTAAEAAGIPRQVVETYFAGLKALEASQTLALANAVGGQETLDAAREWAKTGLNDKDLAFYNENVVKPETAETAVKWLADKYRAANPSEGKLVTNGQTGGQPAGDVFKSAHEVTEAMRDPRYGKDPAYRQSVAEKLARSKAAGTYQTGASRYSGG